VAGNEGISVSGKASRTALRVAVHRAVHQLLDQPLVFTDPLALPILGPEEARAVAADPAGASRYAWAPYIRALVAVRARVAEDTLAELVRQGLRQYVVLGAGLDTFAYRNPWPDLRVWEVDHPATQAWKREQLARSGIGIPSPAPFVPVDFERERVTDALAAAGLDPAAPTFFSWLGVTPYLARPAIDATLAAVASATRQGGGVVFDYGVSRKHLSLVERAVVAYRARKLKAIGEPWRTAFDPPALVAEMRALGFAEVEDLTPAVLNARYLDNAGGGLRISNAGHIMRAVTPVAGKLRADTIRTGPLHDTQ